jgi:hypothetical protein
MCLTWTSSPVRPKRRSRKCSPILDARTAHPVMRHSTLFVYRLLLAARHTGGKLTIYKSPHSPSGWDGSLLRAVNVLRPELPKGFLPTSLGNPLDRVAKQFRSDTRKNGV